ncbi:hypothetical protein F5X97DRAFT_318370 [Nemania serpens]|nr:hypothetical protein F5X97DRAFT_318370 [Nemania serpens]
MAVPNSLLGPILGGLLGFLGAIGAAIITFILSQRDRLRRMDEERIEDDGGHELGHILHDNGFPHREIISAGGVMHHNGHLSIERCIEVSIARSRKRIVFGTRHPVL